MMGYREIKMLTWGISFRLKSPLESCTKTYITLRDRVNFVFNMPSRNIGLRIFRLGFNLITWLRFVSIQWARSKTWQNRVTQTRAEYMKNSLSIVPNQLFLFRIIISYYCYHPSIVSWLLICSSSALLFS